MLYLRYKIQSSQVAIIDCNDPDDGKIISDNWLLAERKKAARDYGEHLEKRFSTVLLLRAL